MDDSFYFPGLISFTNSFLLNMVTIITNNAYIVLPAYGCALNFVANSALMQKVKIANTNTIQLENLILFRNKYPSGT